MGRLNCGERSITERIIYSKTNQYNDEMEAGWAGVCVGGRMDGGMAGWMDGLMDEWIGGWIYRWMDGWMGGLMDG